VKVFVLLLLAGCASQQREPVSPSLAARRECFKLLTAPSIQSADDFLRLGRAQRALAEKAPESPEGLRGLRCTLAAFEAASSLTPTDPVPPFEAAQTYFDLREFRSASRAFHRVLEIEPLYPAANLRLAQIARSGGDVPEATAYLKEEKRVNPEAAEAWVEQGNIDMSTRNFLSAETQFTRAHQLAPRNRDALFGRALARHLLGSFVAAEQDLGAVLALDPNFADGYWQLGLLHEKMNEPKKAISDYRAFLVRTNPASPLAANAGDKIRQLSRVNSASKSTH